MGQSSESMPAAAGDGGTHRRLVALVCLAQVLVQIGAFFWPALLPQLAPQWGLSNSAAGWVTAAFYGAYMLAVPVLVTLTDRIDPKRIYLLGVTFTIAGHLLFAVAAEGFWSAVACRLLTGIGWAGTYMTGLKLLADRVNAKMMARATAGHAASIGVSGALSFATGERLSHFFGWPSAFVVASASAAVASLIVLAVVPWQAPKVKKASSSGTFDFGPVFRNRSAMAYAMAYAIHTLELGALRGWAVAFLAYVAAQEGVREAWLSPAMLATVLGLIGTTASIIGNEMSIRFGRKRLIRVAMLASAALAGTLGCLGTRSYALAAVLVLVYGVVVWLDSSSLTAGAAGTAEPSRRGATLAVHSMLGYGGGFVGPLMIGWMLDLAGGMSTWGWGLAYASVAVLSLGALAVFVRIDPAELAGDKGSKSA